MILTAARTGEILEAKWSKIDVDEAAWTIPPDRMKAGREHRVPLPPRCIEILEKAKLLLAAGSDYLFPGRSNDKPMVQYGITDDGAPARHGLHGARFPVGISRLGFRTHQLRP